MLHVTDDVYDVAHAGGRPVLAGQDDGEGGCRSYCGGNPEQKLFAPTRRSHAGMSALHAPRLNGFFGNFRAKTVANRDNRPILGQG